MNNILLLGATFGTGNMGVGALTAGALTVVARRYPQATISLLDYGHEAAVSLAEVEGRTISVPLVNLRFSWKLLLANNVAALLALSLLGRLGGRSVRNWLIRRNRWLRAIARADAAVAVSGGDSFSDIYGLGRFFYVTLPQLLAMSLGVKLILLPQTIGPFQSAPSRWIGRFIMRRATRVYSRDQSGIDVVRQLLGNAAQQAKARFCFDMGFVVEPHPPRHLDIGGLDDRNVAQGRPLVGLNVSGLLLMGGYTRGNMFALKLDYSDLIDRLVEHLIEQRNVNVLLVPHVFGNDAESDTAAARAVHQRLKGRLGARLFCVEGQYDQNEIKHIIGRCDFFVGSRMHACIAALSQHIPAVGIAYSDKFSGVFDSIGAGSMVADLRQLTQNEAIDGITRAFDARESTRRYLREAMPGIKAHVVSLLDDIE